MYHIIYVTTYANQSAPQESFIVPFPLLPSAVIIRRRISIASHFHSCKRHLVIPQHRTHTIFEIYYGPEIQEHPIKGPHIEISDMVSFKNQTLAYVRIHLRGEANASDGLKWTLSC